MFLLYVPVVTISARDYKKLNYQNFLRKNLKGEFIGMHKKQKGRIQIRQINVGIFSNQIFSESIDYLF